MQALILAGGEGTRLRPLTSTVPKPVVPLVDRPFIAFMLEWLRGHGVDDVVMSCGHLAAGVRNVLGDGSAFGMRLRYVEEPSADQVDARTISAGAYVLERSVLDLLPADQPASIERDVFPQLVGQGLYGYVADGYWLEIGTPERYLQATFDILEATVTTAVAERMRPDYLCVEDGVQSDGRIIPSALVETDCRIGAGARVGGRVVLERGGAVGAGTTLERAVVMQGAEIGANCRLHGCIVAGGVRIGDDCVVEGLSVLGEGATLGDGNVGSNGARLAPGVSLPDQGLLFQ